MKQQTSTSQLTSEAKDSFTMEERSRLCKQFNCSLKDLIIAEGKVGADPDLILDYFNQSKENDVL